MDLVDYAFVCVAIACLVGILVIKCTGWRWSFGRPGPSASPALLAAPPDPTLFALYKQILSSVLPPNMLSDDGLLRTPGGQGEGIRFIPQSARPGERTQRSWWDIALSVFSSKEKGARYEGGLPHNVLLKNLKTASGERPARWHASLLEQARKLCDGVGATDVIDLSNAMGSSSLAHETFHDIQNYLLTHHPRIYSALLQQSLEHESQIRAWYTSPETTSLRGYTLEQVYAKSFDLKSFELLLENARISALAIRAGISVRDIVAKWPDVEAVNQQTDVTFPGVQAVSQRNAVEKYRLEIIPMLMGAAAECDQRAIAILGEIFTAAGLNPRFVEVWPWREKPISTAVAGNEAETHDHADT